MRAIRVLDSAPLVRRGVVVLELDTPSPLLGVAIGMFAEIVWKDGGRERVDIKGLGFASSTPEHAHLIVGAPKRGEFQEIERIEIEPRA
ncbi:MAG: hypothetical protein HYV09_07465 [Deltaproteobacteria bacterium]|nr:hypothetical protein [Deltaproteobacteria bacterium]